jgi:hypothetical protein
MTKVHHQTDELLEHYPPPVILPSLATTADKPKAVCKLLTTRGFDKQTVRETLTLPSKVLMVCTTCFKNQ